MPKLMATYIVALVLLLTSCKKGDAGPAGATGATGNANVSETTFQVNSWTSGSSYWLADFNVSALTATNLTSSAVEVFFSTNNGTNWYAVPYTAVGSTNYFMGFATGANLVEVQWTYNGAGNGSDPNTYFGVTAVLYKIVVIPPAMKIPNVNTHDYNTLKAVYNLKD